MNWEFLNQDLVDEVIVTLAPFLVGGKNSVTFVQGEGFASIQNSTKLKIKRILRQRNELVLHYTKL